MFKLDTEEALRAAFRPPDRALVELAPEITLPALVRHYLAWTHPAGGRVYLVFAAPGDVPTGVVFDLHEGAGASVPQMCDWCHRTAAGEVGLLTARVNAKKRAGIHVCADLGCKQKLEEEAERTGRSALPALEKLVGRMGRFASEVLKIDLRGANR